MNSLQKVQVEKMRTSGIGFKEISEKTNIPVSTIKSYCYKHSIQDITAESDAPLCPQCGQPVPKMRFKPRRFCSDACRAKYWNQHPDEMKKRSVLSTTVPTVAKPLMTMPVAVVSTARIHAISPPAMGVSSMDNQQFDRELKYQVSMSIVRQMLNKGIVSADNYEKWRQRLIERYDPPIGRIVSNQEG